MLVVNLFLLLLSVSNVFMHRSKSGEQGHFLTQLIFNLLADKFRSTGLVFADKRDGNKKWKSW